MLTRTGDDPGLGVRGVNAMAARTGAMRGAVRRTAW